jgi:uncharacterized damage-inducible protein DinB
MKSMFRTFVISAAFSTCCAEQGHTQTPVREPDPIVVSMQMGAGHIRAMFTQAIPKMSEEDFAFQPTPQIRTFGQLLAHVAETNYWFCAAALGEKSPATDIEKTRTRRDDIVKVLGESFDYCDRAFAAMNDPANARRSVMFHGQPATAGALLNYRNYHGLLHWGNAITYMRLRGKVPPTNS